MAKHWVEDLFPPTFQLKDREISSPKFSSSRTSPCKSAAIYERVKREFDSERFKRCQKGVQTDLIDEEVQMSILKLMALNIENNNGQKEQETAESESDKENMWSSSEIEILRKVFLDTKRKNEELIQQIRSNEEELKKVSELAKKLESESQSIKENNKQLIKAIKRKEIKIRYSEDELKEHIRKLRILEDDLFEVREQNVQLKLKLQLERKELVSERAGHREAELTLARIGRDIRTEGMRNTEKLKIEYEMEISKLRKRLHEMQKRLEKEEAGHERSKKGLELLRHHFASLPTEPNTGQGRNGSTDHILENFEIF